MKATLGNIWTKKIWQAFHCIIHSCFKLIFSVLKLHDIGKLTMQWLALINFSIYSKKHLQ